MNTEPPTPEIPSIETPAEKKAVENRFELRLFEEGITSFQRVKIRTGLSAITLTVYCTSEQELNIVPKLPSTFDGLPVETRVTGTIKGPRKV